VPKAGGAPAGGAEVSPALRHAAPAAISTAEARFKNCLREFDMPHILVA
jgi:hypothetical protein